MPDLQRVAATSELSDPGELLVEVDDQLIALFHVGGTGDRVLSARRAEPALVLRLAANDRPVG
jgi:hypothetical protein